MSPRRRIGDTLVSALGYSDGRLVLVTTAPPLSPDTAPTASDSLPPSPIRLTAPVHTESSSVASRKAMNRERTEKEGDRETASHHASLRSGALRKRAGTTKPSRKLLSFSKPGSKDILVSDNQRDPVVCDRFGLPVRAATPPDEPWDGWFGLGAVCGAGFPELEVAASVGASSPVAVSLPAIVWLEGPLTSVSLTGDPSALSLLVTSGAGFAVVFAGVFTQVCAPPLFSHGRCHALPSFLVPTQGLQHPHYLKDSECHDSVTSSAAADFTFVRVTSLRAGYHLFSWLLVCGGVWVPPQAGDAHIVVGTFGRAVLAYRFQAGEGWHTCWRRLLTHCVMGVAIADVDKVRVGRGTCMPCLSLCVCVGLCPGWH